MQIALEIVNIVDPVPPQSRNKLLNDTTTCTANHINPNINHTKIYKGVL